MNSDELIMLVIHRKYHTQTLLSTNNTHNFYKRSPYIHEKEGVHGNVKKIVLTYMDREKSTEKLFEL